MIMPQKIPLMTMYQEANDRRNISICQGLLTRNRMNRHNLEFRINIS